MDETVDLSHVQGLALQIQDTDDGASQDGPGLHLLTMSLMTTMIYGLILARIRETMRAIAAAAGLVVAATAEKFVDAGIPATVQVAVGAHEDHGGIGLLRDMRLLESEGETHPLSHLLKSGASALTRPRTKRTGTERAVDDERVPKKAMTCPIPGRRRSVTPSV